MHGRVFGLERHWLELRDIYADGNRLPSPCRAICRIDRDSGLCEGCLRTLDEIARWGSMTPMRRRALWAELPLRFDRLAREHVADASAASADGDAAREGATAEAILRTDVCTRAKDDR